MLFIQWIKENIEGSSRGPRFSLQRNYFWFYQKIWLKSTRHCIAAPKIFPPLLSVKKEKIIHLKTAIKLFVRKMLFMQWIKESIEGSSRGPRFSLITNYFWLLKKIGLKSTRHCLNVSTFYNSHYENGVPVMFIS